MSMNLWQEKSLFLLTKSASISIPETHELVKLANLIDWISLIRIARICREKSRKLLTGREPQYRQLLGALVLMITAEFSFVCKGARAEKLETWTRSRTTRNDLLRLKFCLENKLKLQKN
jgi:hypothetical protein